MRSPQELTVMFRERGLKITPQRQAVFNALHGNERHPTADVIWARVCEQMPSVSLKTVYQALNDLVALGEVQAVSVDTGAVRFDPNVTDHAHFVCQRCARVYDVVAPRVSHGGPLVDNASAHAQAPEHLVESTEVVFRGTCASCATDCIDTDRIDTDRIDTDHIDT